MLLRKNRSKSRTDRQDSKRRRKSNKPRRNSGFGRRLAVEPLEERMLLTGFAEFDKLTASDAANGDDFGYSVAVSDDTIVVSARGNDDAGTDSGSVYVFARSGTTWTEEAKLTASDAAQGDQFGESVAISGDTIVVGAQQNHAPLFASGSAYVFSRSGTTWTEQAQLAASDAAQGDLFGSGVAVEGDVVVVSAEGNSGNPGSAYVFIRSGTSWTEEAQLTASDAAGGEAVGRWVAVSGDTIVVGAQFDDDAGSASGSAYVFQEPETGWADANEDAKLTASDAAAGDQFGRSVAVSGDTIVMGAYKDNDAGTSSGSAYVFVRSGTTWTEGAKLTASDAAAFDQFGFSVAVSGDTVVVAASGEGDAGSRTGSAYVFGPDEVAPETTIDSATDGNGTPLDDGGSTFSDSITLEFSGTDNVSVAGFECSLDGGAFVACTNSQTFAGLAVGSHTLNVRAVDTAGNIDPTPASVSWTILPPQEVIIDVKPGSDPNSINVESNGQISVAVFTTEDFDAATIDASTVVFAGAYAMQSALEDVDGDGDLDMVLHFRTEETNLRELYDLLFAADLDADGIIDSTRQEAEVSLEGETLNDIIFQGFDSLDLMLRGRALRELLDEMFA